MANATNDLSNATNSLNSRVNTDLANATNDLSNATNSLNSRVNTDLANATNELYTIVNDLEAHTNIWNNGVVVYKGSDPTPALVPGQVYYLGAGSVWTKANASTNSTAKGMIGLALGTTVADGLLLNGQYSSNQAYSVGAPLYLATNDCAITATMPSLNNQVVRIVGYVIDGNTIMFNPDRTYIEILAQ